MQVLINNSGYQTLLFGIFFTIVFLCTLKKKGNYSSLALSQELKGFAILTVIFAHIGYFLVTDNKFLFPFSILAGVGVNLFLFLSGYGLTISKNNRDENFLQFFKRRLSKLSIPFWVVLVLFILMDYFLLSKTYSGVFIVKAIFGIFTQAKIFDDLNSPLWYFSFIVFNYILFQVFYNKKYPWITAIALFLIGQYFVRLDLETFWGVIGLYKVHTLAFPLGIFFAWLVISKNFILESVRSFYEKNKKYLYFIVTPILIFLIAYLSIHSGVGESAKIEQAISIVSMFLIMIMFVIKKTESKVLVIFGLYSYEIYLLHWPILYRYDFLYKFLPAWVATILYLGLFLLVALVLKKFTTIISVTKK